MKTNRLLQIALTACLLCITANLCAQVTIGSGKEPEKFSALELISNQKAGLRMPLMTTKERNEMAETYKSDPNKNDLAKGLTIYNTTIDCLEFWNGKKWISQCEGECTLEPATVDPNASVTACAESSELASVGDDTGFYMFTYQTMNLYANFSSGTPTSYQWAVDGKCVFGATNKIFAYSPVQTDLVLEEDALGNRKKIVKITCQMVVGQDVVQAADFEVLVVYGGTGNGELYPIYVNAFEGGVSGADIVKVTFAHVNLGAENDTDPCNCLGDLYQWGRAKDGHEKRTSNSYPTNDDSQEYGVATTLDLDPATGQIADGNARYGKFIKEALSPHSWRPTDGMAGIWGDSSGGTTASYNPDKAKPGDPCPVGWKVPSQKQWSSLLAGGITPIINSTTLENGTGLANTWKKQGKMNTTGNTSGYKVSDALYLPAAGYRHHSPGTFYLIGALGIYWSSTVTNSDDSYVLYFPSFVHPSNTGNRGLGSSVRCILE